MEYDNILYPDENRKAYIFDKKIMPNCFVDLNLDKIIDAVTDGREGYNLREIYHTPLKDIKTIKYRQAVFCDMEKKDVCNALLRFSKDVREIQLIKEKKEYRYYKWQQLRWDLHCVTLYCEAVKNLTQHLKGLPLHSHGLQLFLQFLLSYGASEEFCHLEEESRAICAQLDSIKYLIRITGDTVYVERYHNQINFSDEVISVFSKFRQHDVQTDLELKSSNSGMNHVEGQILDRVAMLFPDKFNRMEFFLTETKGYFNIKIEKFEKDIQFYLSFIEYMSKYKKKGLPFCLPMVQRESKKIYSVGSYDLALADSMKDSIDTIIRNDFELDGNERIFLISGPNQGGKTTFARMIGQMHYLAILGLYVPAEQSQFYLVDCIYTHFEQSENIRNLRGKLYDDLVRIKAILNSASSDSLIIMNEIFTSTTSKDATYLGTKIMQKVISLGAIGVCVTFIDELTTLSRSIVSLMSAVDEEKNGGRTYKIIRKPSDGLAYSSSLVKKYCLTYREIKMRIRI
ncbi:MutS-related protein [Pantoea sp. App145]|uniref:MutS-related protein n=1 Tax=Pantoea sp. App145 TaxID=3071567 RepID=UPI003A7FEF6E